MLNYKRAGFIKTKTLAAGVLSGEPILIGTKASVAIGTYAIGDSGEFLQGGVFEFKKTAGLALVQGTKYDYDATAKEIVADAAGDFSIGEADEDVAAGSSVGNILVNGIGYSLS